MLTGSIPATVANLSNLVGLGLDNNQLTGLIPPGIGNLGSLQFFGLSNNQLTGTIPATLSNLSQLQSVRLWGNQLTGGLPDLGGISTLEVYDFGGNQLTGGIPASTWGLPNLQEISLWSNQLSGAIPPDIGNLGATLQTLAIAGNLFSGPIPQEISNLGVATLISMEWNEFTSLPDVSGLTPGNFDVQGNKLQFGDLEPNIGIPGITYDPQSEFGVPDSLLANAGEQVTLSANASGSANLYQWFRDGSPLAGEVNSDLVLPSVGGADVGDYRVDVTNSIVGGLTLTKAAVTLAVTSDLTTSVPDTVEAEGNQMVLPLRIGNPTGFNVISYQLKVAYDPAIVTPATPDATDLTGTLTESGWSPVENIIPGSGRDTLLIADATSGQPLSAAGDLIKLLFDVQSVGVPNVSPIELIEVLFNDGTPASITTDGSIEIVVPVTTTAAGPGVPVPVTLVDQETGGTPLTVTFDEVSGSGQTTMSASDAGTPFPSNFQVPSTSVFFDLTTSATFANNVEVCYDYSSKGIVDDANLRLLHFEGGQWVDVTNDPTDPVNDIICGTVASFSEFGLGDPTGADGVVTALPDPVKPGQGITITVTDVDEDGDDQVVEFINVNVSDVDNGDVQTTSLQETGIATGIFTGVLATNYADGGTVAEDGFLGVKAGDVVTVDYTDVLNASGGTDVKSVTANVVGGVAGSLSNSRVVQEFDSRTGLRDTVRIAITDADGNANSGLAENVDVTVVNSRSGETETLSLGETGLDDGVFQIRVRTVTSPSVNEDGEFSIQAGDVLSVNYDDLAASGATVVLAGAVDVVNLFGDVQSNDKVQAFDAAFALRSAAGSETPNALQELLMDVDGSTQILAADASNILQYVVRLIDRFEVQSNFTTSQNHPFEKPVPVHTIVTLGNLEQQDGGNYFVPVRFGDREGVTSTTLEIGYGLGAKVVGVTKGSGYGSFMVAYHAEEEKVRVALAGSSSQVRGSGDVLWLEVEAGSGVLPDLSLDWVAVNGRILTPLDMAPESQDAIVEPMMPDQFALHQNVPNPFNPQTTISFDVPENSEVSIVVYSMLGQEVVRLLADQREVGRHQVVWSGRDAYGRSVASGLYFVRMNAGSFSQIRRMMLLK